MWVILPVKTLALSKQRLSPCLSQQQRRDLACAMLHDMLTVLSAHPDVCQVLLVSKDQDVLAFKNSYAELTVLLEPAECNDLNDALELACHYAELHGAGRALILHADLPLLNGADLSLLINNHLSGAISLIPDKYEQGTNGLLCELPTPLRFTFGADSFARHLQAIRQLGLACVISDLADLSLDIDMPDDLLQLSQQLAGQQSHSRTAHLLGRPSWQALLQTIPPA